MTLSLAGAYILCFLNRYDIHAGLALNPATPLIKVQPFLGLIDVVTIMSVIPGASGQKFMPEVADKIVELKGFAKDAGLTLGVQVDGGINQKTVNIARSAGANIVVAASALYRKHDLQQAIERLRGNDS